MKIKRIKLKNIRSYVDEEIKFPEGSTLLSGDIGAGKSTILLSMDFALFGLQKGNITGNSLLRSGENNGIVELELDIDGNNIIVRRTLKKEGNKVMQSSGELMINNEKREMTATELKLKILDLLNYPKELLTKSKSLIYRYTVYTPQEEMKQILMADKDSRLDILRKIFGIDKYKRIKDNSKIYIQHLKGKKKELEGMFSDIIEKKGLKEEREKELEKLNESISEILPKISGLDEIIDAKKNALNNIENNMKELQKTKEEHYKINIELENNIRQKEKNNNEIETIDKEVKEHKESDIDIEDINNKIKLKESYIDTSEKEINEINNELSILKNTMENSEKLKNKIIELENCPTCQQKVSEDHKSMIKNTEDNKIRECNERINLILINKKEKEETLNNLKLELNNLKDIKKNYEIELIKSDNILGKKEKLRNLINENNELNNKIMLLKKQKEEIDIKIKNSENLENDYQNIRKEIEDLNENKKEIEIKKGSIEKEISLLKRNILELENEIMKKEKAKKKFVKYSKLHNWMDEEFFNLVDNMEKQIMFKVHNDFNSLFERWFDILMNNEIIKVRLDEEFTPIIQQNGYDVDYEYISGGERTSAALSYRLALNQVINNIISGIKTRDILILDEPTDGFSSEQLDRLRDVLNELNLKQIIIVSHDPKIETFVDNIIKINKEEHMSKAL